MNAAKKFEKLAEISEVARTWHLLYRLKVISLSEALVSALRTQISENYYLISKKVSPKLPGNEK